MRASRSAIVYLDLDKFKHQNDQFGHAHGDQVLADLVRIIRQNIGSDDLIGRLGGDEFVVLMKDRNCADVQRTIERVVEQAG